MNVRENWRIVMLVALVLFATFLLFAPSGGVDAAPNATDRNVTTADEGATNLKYGLELSGGTSIRAPLVGMTATGVDVSVDDQYDTQRRIAAALNVSLGDVRVDAREGTVEVFADRAHGNVTQAEFRQAIRSEGLQPEEVRNGTTDDTIQRTKTVLNNKLNQGGLSGGSATIANPATGGESYVVVEVPGASRAEVLDLIGDPGRVQVVAVFPVQENGNTTYRRVPLFSQDGISQVGQAEENRRQGPHVDIQLTPEAAQNFSNAMQKFGFTSDEGIRNCQYRTNKDDPGYCLLTVQDGEVVYANSMGDLATTINNGNFVENPSFVITAGNISQARELAVNLRAGALPTNLAIQEGTSYYLEPSLAERFKLFSLLTGLVAVAAVSGVVFLRYREPKVALPMLATAAAEVYLLLGFAAGVGLPLDLSHIAGFIAVIGTGVDDLIIIADEILQRGDIRTSRVFQSRFKKAFWVIGAAAATTIVAMSPLAVLSLGDLQGFAIVTIVGVLLGVLVTRPAYGDVLRNLILE